MAEGGAHGAVGVETLKPADPGAHAIGGANGMAGEAEGLTLVLGDQVIDFVREELPEGLNAAEQGRQEGAEPRLERRRVGARGEGGHDDMVAGVGTDRHGWGDPCGREGGCEGHLGDI